MRTCFLSLAIALFSAGCSYNDWLACTPTETQNVPTVRSDPRIQPQVQPRPWEQRIVYYQNGSVEHGPLYFQDPYEYIGTNDGQIRTWGPDDLEAFFASPVTLVINGAFLPVKLVDTPPWESVWSHGIYPEQLPVYEISAPRSKQLRDRQFRNGLGVVGQDLSAVRKN